MFKNGIYNLAGTVARLGLSILSVPLLLQFLGSSSYGLYAILQAIINLAVLSEWSICMVLTVFVSQTDDEETNTNDTLRQALVLVVGLASITSLILWIASPLLTLAFPNLNNTDRELLQRGCQSASIVVFFRLLQQYFVGIEQAYGQYKLLNSINTFFNISQTALILIVARWYEGIIPLVIVQAGTSIFFLIIHWSLCYKKKLLITFKWDGNLRWNQFKRMLLFGGRTFIGGVGSAFFNQGDRIIVGRLLGLEASGVYSALTGIATQIHTLSTMSVQPLIPVLSRLLSEENAGTQLVLAVRNKLKTTICRATMLNAVLAVGMGCFMITFAPEISFFLFKHQMPNSFNTIKALRIIASIYTLYSLNGVGYYILFAIKREGINTIVSLICGPFSLLMIGLLAHFYGLTGALIGNMGYLFTLYLLIVGFKLVHLKWITWLSVVWKPLSIFILVILVTPFIDSLISRIIIFVSLSGILCLPIFKEGYNYILLKDAKV